MRTWAEGRAVKPLGHGPKVTVRGRARQSPANPLGWRLLWQENGAFVMCPRSRIFATGVLGGALVLLAAGSARARDGGLDAGVTEDAAKTDGGDAGAHPAACIAIGNPCTKTDVCCEADAGAYCGEFGGQEEYACGLAASSNKLSNGCAVGITRAGGGDGGRWLGLLCLAVATGWRRRRPGRRVSPAP